MPTYVTLCRWTEQGIRTVEDSLGRATSYQQAVEAVGGRVLSVYWTQGAYDVILTTEWPDEETAMAAALRLSRPGNVRTETLRAFGPEEMWRFLDPPAAPG
jgi:uncharacterized protein with GYD domain